MPLRSWNTVVANQASRLSPSTRAWLFVRDCGRHPPRKDPSEGSPLQSPRDRRRERIRYPDVAPGTGRPRVRGTRRRPLRTEALEHIAQRSVIRLAEVSTRPVCPDRSQRSRTAPRMTSCFEVPRSRRAHRVPAPAAGPIGRCEPCGSGIRVHQIRGGDLLRPPAARGRSCAQTGWSTPTVDGMTPDLVASAHGCRSAAPGGPSQEWPVKEEARPTRRHLGVHVVRLRVGNVRPLGRHFGAAAPGRRIRG